MPAVRLAARYMLDVAMADDVMPGNCVVCYMCSGVVLSAEPAVVNGCCRITAPSRWIVPVFR